MTAKIVENTALTGNNKVVN